MKTPFALLIIVFMSLTASVDAEIIVTSSGQNVQVGVARPPENGTGSSPVVSIPDVYPAFGGLTVEYLSGGFLAHASVGYCYTKTVSPDFKWDTELRLDVDNPQGLAGLAAHHVQISFIPTTDDRFFFTSDFQSGAVLSTSSELAYLSDAGLATHPQAPIYYNFFSNAYVTPVHSTQMFEVDLIAGHLYELFTNESIGFGPSVQSPIMDVAQGSYHVFFESSVAAVPEPSSVALFGLVAMTFACWRGRQNGLTSSNPSSRV